MPRFSSFVTVTKEETGKPAWVNVDKILYFRELPGRGSRVVFGNDIWLDVSESGPDIVARLQSLGTTMRRSEESPRRPRRIVSLDEVPARFPDGESESEDGSDPDITESAEDPREDGGVGAYPATHWADPRFA